MPGPNGYGAVQVSPVNEHILLGDPYAFAWYQRYQVVSYKIVSRSGNKAQFKDAIDRCDKAGVKIYVDFIPNHMTGDSNGVGIAGSQYNGKTQSYPGVPYSREHFNMNIAGRCPTRDGNIHNFESAIETRNCMLEGLRDLDQGQEYVRQKIADAMNELTELGVAGFRIDAMKHMWPGDVELMFKLLKPMNATMYGENKYPFIYHEIAYSPGEVSSSQYTHLGRPIEFRYLNALQDTIKKRFDHSKLANLK